MKSIVLNSIIFLLFFGYVCESKVEFNKESFANASNNVINTIETGNYELTYLITEHNAQLNLDKIAHKTRDLLSRIGIDENDPEYNDKFDNQLIEFMKSRTDVFRLHRLIKGRDYVIIEYQPISFEEATKEDIIDLQEFKAPFINIIDAKNGICYEIDKRSRQLKKYDSIVFSIDPDLQNAITPQNIFSFDLKRKGAEHFADSIRITNRPDIDSFIDKDKVMTFDLAKPGSKFKQLVSVDQTDPNKMIEFIGSVDDTVVNVMNWLDYKKIEGLSFEIPMMMINELFNKTGGLMKSKTIEIMSFDLKEPIKTNEDLENYIKGSIDESFSFFHFNANNEETKLELPGAFK